MFPFKFSPNIILWIIGFYISFFIVSYTYIFFSVWEVTHPTTKLIISIFNPSIICFSVSTWATWKTVNTWSTIFTFYKWPSIICWICRFLPFRLVICKTKPSFACWVVSHISTLIIVCIFYPSIVCNTIFSWSTWYSLVSFYKSPCVILWICRFLLRSLIVCDTNIFFIIRTIAHTITKFIISIFYPSIKCNSVFSWSTWYTLVAFKFGPSIIFWIIRLFRSFFVVSYTYIFFS